MGDITDGLPVGEKFVSRGRTIWEGDLSLLTNLTWATDSVHADAEFTKKYMPHFGGITLPGPCIVAVAVGDWRIRAVPYR